MRVIKQYKLLFVFLLTVVISIISCQKDDPILLYHTKKPTFDSFSINGALTLIDGSIVNDEELQVYSFVSNGFIEAMTADSILPFSVEVVDSENYQIVMFSTNEPGNIVYMGLYDPLQQTITANDTTTALALCMLNPLLIGTNYNELNQFFNELETVQSFELMLKNIADNHQNAPNHLFSYEHNSALYGLAFNAAKEAMESLGSSNNNLKNDSVSHIPYIAEVAGSSISFVNPNNVWYGAAIYTIHRLTGKRDTLKDETKIQIAATRLEHSWAWPPDFSYQKLSTNYALGDGLFQIELNSRFHNNWTEETEHSPAKAIGTRLNVLQGIYSLLNLSIGEEPDDEFENLYEHIELENHKEMLNSQISQANVPELIKVFCSLLTYNKNDVADWLLHNKSEHTGSAFISATANMIHNNVQVYELWGYSEIKIPFFYDFVYTQNEITYRLEQQDGNIIGDIIDIMAPVADFQIEPKAGTVGNTLFTFNAANSYDITDDFNDLEFRWDYFGNGEYTSWGKNFKIENYIYHEAGTYDVVLQVRNKNNMIGTKKRRLTVTRETGSAYHVKVFENIDPFFTTAIKTVLDSLQTSISFQYDMLTSDKMSTVELNPQTDLVIIASNQKQDFYDHYAENNTRFNEFVLAGGSILWATCNDIYVDSGSLTTAGVVLPGAVEPEQNSSNTNTVIIEMPLTDGLDPTLHGNPGSYYNFNNVPEGSIIYCVDNQNKPTLIEFYMGDGRVILTGQPLEKHYSDNNNMKSLLERIIRSLIIH